MSEVGEASSSWQGTGSCPSDTQTISSYSYDSGLEMYRESLVVREGGREIRPCSSSHPPQGDGELQPWHLVRAMTQPRDVYEAVLGAPAPSMAPDDLPAGISEAGEASSSRRGTGSCTSDAETNSSYDSGREMSPKSVVVREDGREIRSGSDSAGRSNGTGRIARQRSRRQAHRRNALHGQRFEAEWVKSFLAKPTGYGCFQRSCVAQVISRLEGEVQASEADVGRVSCQVSSSREMNLQLGVENDDLKRRIAKLEQRQQQIADEKSSLEEELEGLRTDHAKSFSVKPREQAIVRQCSLVRLPSSLYRSISAIRSDMLDIGALTIGS